MATAHDFERIAELFDLYRQFYLQISDLEASKSFIRERLTNNESVIFCAVTADLAVGFVQLYPSFSSVSMKKLWILNDLFVHPDSRKKGVASKLLEAATQFAIETKAKALTLKTAQDNLPAQALYSSLGWKLNTRFQTYDLAIEQI